MLAKVDEDGHCCVLLVTVLAVRKPTKRAKSGLKRVADGVHIHHLCSSPWPMSLLADQENGLELKAELLYMGFHMSFHQLMKPLTKGPYRLPALLQACLLSGVLGEHKADMQYVMPNTQVKMVEHPCLHSLCERGGGGHCCRGALAGSELLAVAVGLQRHLGQQSRAKIGGCPHCQKGMVGQRCKALKEDLLLSRGAALQSDIGSVNLVSSVTKVGDCLSSDQTQV